ncbi:cytochrome c3 family protein [Desulfoluna spongiiphila]|uniref:cytochrome c3 family protein n=1 Tax=Desulfoluna spongiiphila TaxID=419481 RepID=UPI0012539EBA|nr:cytochrome c3 family protein [Desulfoluna spongiiphila]VVS91627.1 c-type polyheme cytochrome omcb [Desulfoluna spongiiphila]
MDKIRTRSCVTSFFMLAALALCPVAPTAGAAEADAKQRPSVSFPHEMHFDVAEDCLSCHHDYQDGENVLDEDLLMETEPEETMVLNSMDREELSAVSCLSCHGDDAKTGPMDAFHNQCISCHEAEKAGPVMCGECHVRP